jgi:hypothetical protein
MSTTQTIFNKKIKADALFITVFGMIEIILGYLFMEAL